VGDEQVGEPLLALQIHHQVDDLRLDRHVERGNGLVGDDQLGIERQRAGNRNPLALAALEFVREALHLRGAQADLLEQRGYELGLLLAAANAVHFQRIPHDVSCRHPWIKR